MTCRFTFCVPLGLKIALLKKIKTGCGLGLAVFCVRKPSAAPEPDPTAAYAGPSRGSHLGMGEAAGEGTGKGDAARVSEGDSSNPCVGKP